MKRIIIIIFLTIFVIASLVRYITLNANVARHFHEVSYNIGEEIPLGNRATFKIDNEKWVKNAEIKDAFNLILTGEFDNLSDEHLRIDTLITDSIIPLDFIPRSVEQVSFNFYSEKNINLQDIPPKTKIPIYLEIPIIEDDLNKNDLDNLYFYISRSIYRDEYDEYLAKGERLLKKIKIPRMEIQDE